MADAVDFIQTILGVTPGQRARQRANEQKLKEQAFAKGFLGEDVSTVNPGYVSILGAMGSRTRDANSVELFEAERGRRSKKRSDLSMESQELSIARQKEDAARRVSREQEKKSNDLRLRAQEVAGKLAHRHMQETLGVPLDVAIADKMGQIAMRDPAIRIDSAILAEAFEKLNNPISAKLLDDDMRKGLEDQIIRIETKIANRFKDEWNIATPESVMHALSGAEGDVSDEVVENQGYTNQVLEGINSFKARGPTPDKDIGMVDLFRKFGEDPSGIDQAVGQGIVDGAKWLGRGIAENFNQPFGGFEQAGPPQPAPPGQTLDDVPVQDPGPAPGLELDDGPSQYPDPAPQKEGARTPLLTQNSPKSDQLMQELASLRKKIEDELTSLG